MLDETHAFLVPILQAELPANFFGILNSSRRERRYLRTNTLFKRLPCFLHVLQDLDLLHWC